MIQILRILAVSFQFKNSNFRYKIAYLRNNNDGYNVVEGDILDEKIFEHFNDKNPMSIGWEYAQIHNLQHDLTQYLYGLIGKNISLIISPNFDGLEMLELDAIQNSNITFPQEYCQVTLYYRSNLNEESENWIFLPRDSRISLPHKIYRPFAQTIFPHL